MSDLLADGATGTNMMARSRSGRPSIESHSSARYPADPDARVPKRVGPFLMAENVEEKQ